MGVHLDSALTFSHHFSSLTRSCYFHLRRLRVIRRSVSSEVLQTLIHAFVINRIDYCSSIYLGLPRYRLASLQSVLNSAARLIARLPRFSPISAYSLEHLHWLPISLRIQLRVLIHVLRSLTACAPAYVSDLVLRPLSPTASRPLRSLTWLDLYVPSVRTSFANAYHCCAHEGIIIHLSPGPNHSPSHVSARYTFMRSPQNIQSQNSASHAWNNNYCERKWNNKLV